jgi:hypothetical protein
MALVAWLRTTPLPNDVTTPELLTLLLQVRAGFTAAREWVPATAPEMVKLNAADDAVSRYLAAVEVPDAPEPTELW